MRGDKFIQSLSLFSRVGRHIAPDHFALAQPYIKYSLFAISSDWLSARALEQLQGEWIHIGGLL